MKSKRTAPINQDKVISREDFDEYAPQKRCMQVREAYAMSPSADLCKSGDPFLFYSNSKIRMKALRAKEVPETVPVKEMNVPRKTILSFELDPILVLKDAIQEIFDIEDDASFSCKNTLPLSDKCDFGSVSVGPKSDVYKAYLLAQLL
eukprot:CAMPEP_0183733996 /NCGR_PEP_ID=MMETSP0737-20130205/42611_1 /TAXON_ID=385413 /ORGANISM="Thalassiosira miniscula, Strain CCMP1093" /LENGTH=147 /DNA_ID=CAMNT_0025967379 /DNA_START=141 /DNA_END=584 /DNA_ORIENTATION=+